MNLKFSLIMATLGRSDEIVRLFDSFVAQTYQNFEVIVIDQNDDDRVVRIVTAFSDRLDIKYLRSEKGLSRARNVGLEHVGGELVAFPDDDCWYAPHTLEYIVTRFQADASIAGLTGCSEDGSGKLSQGRWAQHVTTVTRFNVWTCATSYTIFLRADSIANAQGFDESLGVGSGTKWGAGEEVNFLLGVIGAGAHVVYDPAIRIYHPEPLLEMNESSFRRARLYNRGFGHVLGTNDYPVHYVLYLVGRSVVGCGVAALKLDFGRARYYWIASSQRLLGWLDGRAAMQRVS